MSDDLKERTKHKIADRHPNWSTMQKLLDRIEELERERVLSLREKRDYAYEAMEAERQRDEALAEVERLREALKACLPHVEDRRRSLAYGGLVTENAEFAKRVQDDHRAARDALNATTPDRDGGQS